MDSLIVLIAFSPIALAIASKVIWHNEITWGELAIMAILPMIFIVILYHQFRFNNATDNELWNGQIVEKVQRKENCPWGWKTYRDDFCTNYRTRQVYDGEDCTGFGKDRVCTSKYHTEYKYDYDWEQRYFIKTDIKDHTFEVDRVDYQGVSQPPIWRGFHVGDPASLPNTYMNWIRAAADSLFHQDGEAEEKYKGRIPAYPDKIYNYIQVNRVLTVGIDVPEVDRWNRELSMALRELGPKRQMNAIIVIANSKEFAGDYIFAVRRYWQGFKKNDAVLFIGADPETKKIGWVDVLSWSKNNAFNVVLRDTVYAIGSVSENFAPLVIQALSTVGMDAYERRSMKEFEFLKQQIPTPIWLYFVTFFVGVLSTGGVWFFALGNNWKPSTSRRSL